MRHISFLLANKWLVIAAISFFGIIAPATGVHAITQDISLTAAPAVLDAGGKPGGEIELSFELTNNTDKAVPIQLVARDSQVKDGQSADLVRALSAKSWVMFDQPDLVLQPKETEKVQAKLRIPDDASPGGHYADLIVQPLFLEGGEVFIATQSELAVQLLAHATGDIAEELKVRPSGPSSVITTNRANKKLVFDVSNHGNIHTLFRPRLSIQKGGKEHAVIDSLPTIILPSERKQIEFQLPTDLSSGAYGAQVQFTYGAAAKEVTSSAVKVIVLPFGPAFLLIVPALALVLFGFHLRHRIVSAIRVIARGESNLH